MNYLLSLVRQKLLPPLWSWGIFIKRVFIRNVFYITFPNKNEFEGSQQNPARIRNCINIMAGAKRLPPKKVPLYAKEEEYEEEYF